ncbi:MAG TPA: hypothetical protein VFD70_27660 [Anaerolineae bacterium]|nr:hypothetical protein [Anaerolineae bacterium]
MSDNEVSYEDLIAYAANELPAKHAAQVRRYIETHLEAFKTVERYRAIRALLTARPKQMPSLRATAHAQAIFRRKPTQRKRRRSAKFVRDVFLRMRQFSTWYKTHPFQKKYLRHIDAPYRSSKAFFARTDS